MTAKSNIGSQLKTARKKAKLTQKEVAEKVEINTNYYARIERNEETPSLDVLKAIAKLLNIKSLDVINL